MENTNDVFKPSMSQEKMLIWSYDVDYLDGEENEDGSPMTYEEKVDLNESCLWVERDNLDIHCEDIICIASVGRWNGRKTGYKLLGNNIANILYSIDGGDCEWFYDGKDIRGIEHHHDGTNYYLYRILDDSTSFDDIDKLMNNLNWNNVEKFTSSLADVVKEIYGW